MLSDEQRIKNKEKKKKILITAVISVIGLFAVLGLVVLILSGIRNSVNDRNRKALEDAGRQRYTFAEPDYNLNIFEDDYYMQLDRHVWVFDGNSRTVITDDNYRNYAPEVNFIRQVINYIISGDYTAYNAIFTDEYLKNAGDDLREVFPMQQLYNIEAEVVEYNQRRPDGNGFARDSVIKVCYMVRNNTGTFRNDLDYNEEAWLPVVYKITTFSDASDNVIEMKVTGLMTYAKYLSGLYD